MSGRYIIGDCLDVLASLEPGSVDLAMSSPPFLALRSYLPADHPDKAREIGSEATPGEFIDTMLDVVEACARVLAPHGSLVFELGDTYAGSGGEGAPGFTGSANASREALKDANARHWREKNRNRDGWPLDKSKVLIPQLFAISLAYGFNPLTGRTTEPWRVRNTVAWCRPNPPVGRDGDKFRPATSFLTVACKARERYWDGDAVRTPYTELSLKNHGGAGTLKDGNANGPKDSPSTRFERGVLTNAAGAPLLDWWEIPTAPYKGSHYATYPPDLVVPVVKSMCPQKVCRECGKPSTRITETTRVRIADGMVDPPRVPPTRDDAESGTTAIGIRHAVESRAETLGWSDCGHDAWRTGVCLDPFAGSGTTLAVATGHGLDCIGIDLDARNAELARERVGMFLTVE